MAINAAHKVMVLNASNNLCHQLHYAPTETSECSSRAAPYRAHCSSPGGKPRWHDKPMSRPHVQAGTASSGGSPDCAPGLRQCYLIHNQIWKIPSTRRSKHPKSCLSWVKSYSTPSRPPQPLATGCLWHHSKGLEGIHADYHQHTDDTNPNLCMTSLKVEHVDAK